MRFNPHPGSKGCEVPRVVPQAGYLRINSSIPHNLLLSLRADDWTRSHQIFAASSNAKFPVASVP